MITEEHARQLADLPKVASDPLVWEERGNHAGNKFCYSIVQDVSGAVLPGLTVQLEVRAPVKVVSCFFLFTLFKLADRQRLRVYQLEVAPLGKRTHNGREGALYGPHEHFGEEAFAVQDPAVTCDDWSACLAYFARRCSLTLSHVLPPC